MRVPSETETSLYYYRTRYYDPTIGRFLSEDRVLMEGMTFTFTLSTIQ